MRKAICVLHSEDSILFMRRRLFFDPNRIVQADSRRNYGEERFQLTGMIEQRLFVVVYTPRHDAMRIISARKANQREVIHYENSTGDD